MDAKKKIKELYKFFYFSCLLNNNFLPFNRISCRPNKNVNLPTKFHVNLTTIRFLSPYFYTSFTLHLKYQPLRPKAKAGLLFFPKTKYGILVVGKTKFSHLWCLTSLFGLFPHVVVICPFNYFQLIYHRSQSNNKKNVIFLQSNIF